MTDWLDSVFRYPSETLLPIFMVSVFIASVVCALLFRRMSWTSAALLAVFVVLAIFSVVLTAYNGVRSTSGLGSIFLFVYGSIVAFPTAGLIWAIKVVMARPKEPTGEE